MLRAAKGGLGLVDTLDQWPVWQSLAHSAGVSFRPVVEALPIEEWYASMSTRSAAQAGGDALPKLETAAGTAVVTTAALLESLPILIRERLNGWITKVDVGLSTSQVPAVLMDRMADIANGLSGLADSVQLLEAPFEADQAQRLELVLSPFNLVREEAPDGLEAMERFLIANWQPRSGSGNRVTGFKPSQTIAMEAICERSANVLVSLPTGEGKSSCCSRCRPSVVACERRLTWSSRH